MGKLLTTFLGWLVKQKFGLVAAVAFLVILGAIWLIYDLVPNEEPLTATQLLGAAVVDAVLVLAAVAFWQQRSASTLDDKDGKPKK